jgi:hypothetical protein
VPRLQIINSATNKIAKGTPIIITSVIIILSCGFYLFFKPESSRLESHKLIMPGSYKVNLQAGPYCVWRFNKWRSAKINSLDASDLQQNYRIDDCATNKRLMLCEREAPYAFEYSADGLHGQLLWDLHVPRDGSYIVSNVKSSTPSVLVLAQRKAHFVDLGGNTVFEGMQDNDFEQSAEAR